MSSSDRSGELPLFRDAPGEPEKASIPSWRPSLADGWSSKAPSRRTVEVQGRDLLCRNLEFLEGTKRVRAGTDGDRLREFGKHQEELARALVEWPDVEAGDDEVADAARLVADTVDELATLRRQILQELDEKARKRALAAERRASREPRELERIRSLAEFLLAEARGDVVEVSLPLSFRSPDATPEP